MTVWQLLSTPEMHWFAYGCWLFNFFVAGWTYGSWRERKAQHN